MGGLLEVNYCIGWSRWFGHCVGRSLCRLVDVGQSLWVACCVGWSLWVGRCGLVALGWPLWVGRFGLVAMLVDRFVNSVVGQSLCWSIAVSRSPQAGLYKSLTVDQSL